MWDTLKGLTGIASSGPVKLALILAIITALIGYKTYSDKAKYSAGYSAAEVVYLKEKDKALSAAEEAYKASLAEATLALGGARKEADKSREEAVALQELLDSRPTVETTIEITKLVTPDCSDLGIDFKRMSDNIIGTAPQLNSK